MTMLQTTRGRRAVAAQEDAGNAERGVTDAARVTGTLRTDQVRDHFRCGTTGLRKACFPVSCRCGEAQDSIPIEGASQPMAGGTQAGLPMVAKAVGVSGKTQFAPSLLLGTKNIISGSAGPG